MASGRPFMLGSKCKGAFKTSVRKYASYEPTRPINERHHVRNNDRPTNMLLVRRTARCTSLLARNIVRPSIKIQAKRKKFLKSLVFRIADLKVLEPSTFQNFEPLNCQIFPPSTLRALKSPNFQTRKVFDVQACEFFDLQTREAINFQIFEC